MKHYSYLFTSHLQNKITVLNTPSKMSYSPIQQNISFDENIKNNASEFTITKNTNINQILKNYLNEF